MAFAMFLSAYPFHVGIRITADEARVALALSRAKNNPDSLSSRDTSAAKASSSGASLNLYVPSFPPQSLSLEDESSLITMDDNVRNALANVASQVRRCEAVVPCIH